MKKIQKKLNQIFQNKELRKKLLFTAAIFFVYRLLANIPLPAIDVERLGQMFDSNQFLSLLNIFSGGTLSNFSIAAVGISPYITASIVLQMSAMVFPALKEMQKDGQAGQEKYNQYTRLLSVPLGVVQSISVLALLNSQGLIQSRDPLTIITMVMSLIAGGMIVMWLGELLSEYGVGNGISMILFAGIVSQFPVAVAQAISVSSSEQWTTNIIFVGLFLAIISLIVYVNEAIRKVQIQYAKRMRGGRQLGGQMTHLPIRVNVAGVMPIIFAVSLMLAPSFIGRLLISSGKDQFIGWGQNLTIWFSQTNPIYMISYFLIVFIFTFFSALVFFNAEDISKELKKSGAFVPGIRPGSPTKKYLEYVVTRITLIVAIFLGFIAIMPSLAQLFTGVNSLAIGGTSVLIVVSVVLETTKQVESMLVGQNYDQYT
ncbi:MAG: preprotein translocase subunit SecY [Candidatus Pacebacteria bacterium]|nr:preprotein translocase subunit SecY [Candidatus Paceibacterota bacterium]